MKDFAVHVAAAAEPKLYYIKLIYIYIHKCVSLEYLDCSYNQLIEEPKVPSGTRVHK